MTGIERIQKTFLSYPKVSMGYLMAGDGGIDRTFKAAMSLIQGGIHLLEIGVPFSDPIADGPVIQAAATRALAMGTDWSSILQLIKQIRAQSQTPLILFTYLNPLLSALQNSKFLSKARECGVDGILIVDCPFELLKHFRKNLQAHGMALIPVITPSTSIERIEKIDKVAQGFLYYACRKGITGIKNAFPEDFPEQMRRIQKNTKHPVVVGFGISNRAMACQACEYAQGFVIGSLFVKTLELNAAPEILTEVAKEVLNF